MFRRFDYMKAFFGFFVLVLSRRALIFVVMNLVFFVSLFFGVLWARFHYPPAPYWGELEPVGVPEFFLEGGFPMMFVKIFLFNLVLSAFVFVTLSGLVFFVFPVVVLVWRALLWGFLLSMVPSPHFLAVYPTLILEGEGYVLASVAGINLGLSWLKPSWVYGGEDLSRLEAVKKAFKECARIYILVAVLLLVAALTETVTIAMLTSS